VHVLAAGALLFAFFAWTGGGAGPESTRIAITPGRVEHLAAGFARTRQRPPTDAELKLLVDDYVKEEIATREALAMGLDRDDVIVRRRLRQKLEFFAEDATAAAVPTDAELQAWFDAHPESYRAEPRVSLLQVYVSVERGREAGRARAEALLAQLRAAGAGARTDALGDPSLLPPELPLGPASEATRTFGAEFAGRVESLPTGEWTGPVESTYGLHLVLVRERMPAAQPTLADVRPLVERDVLAARRQAELRALYERLLREKYTVAIEMPATPAPDAAR
jgi:hypothetical protein